MGLRLCTCWRGATATANRPGPGDGVLLLVRLRLACLRRRRSGGGGRMSAAAAGRQAEAEDRRCQPARRPSLLPLRYHRLQQQLRRLSDSSCRSSACGLAPHSPVREGYSFLTIRTKQLL